MLARFLPPAIRATIRRSLDSWIFSASRPRSLDGERGCSSNKESTALHINQKVVGIVVPPKIVLFILDDSHDLGGETTKWLKHKFFAVDLFLIFSVARKIPCRESLISSTENTAVLEQEKPAKSLILFSHIKVRKTFKGLHSRWIVCFG